MKSESLALSIDGPNDSDLMKINLFIVSHFELNLGKFTSQLLISY